MFELMWKSCKTKYTVSTPATIIAADSTHDMPMPSSENNRSVTKCEITTNVNELTNFRNLKSVIVNSLANLHRTREVWSTNSRIDINNKTAKQIERIVA